MALLPFLLAAWQWQRAQEKAELLRSLTSAIGVQPVSLLYREASPQPEFTRVALPDAHPAGPVLQLENSYLGEVKGRRVLQPWRLSDGAMALVDLGWLADGVTLPAIDPLALTLRGHWMPLPRHFVLPGAVAGIQGRVDSIDMTALRQRYSGPWHQGVVVLEHSQDPLRHWPVLPEFMPERHYAYAAQWLLLGLLLLLSLYSLRRRSQ
ncbi:SURF1 family protein [Chromobacterium sp. LK1]|uniref:SURF1 family protein n=1 Tax=Chromobacterium sp. LK1 TaxID=1628193 RepID=UPI0009E4E04F|nr:SURF1 family cytochrome oxidase biogenesis protein [Chromobacterium sp. LK1]